MTLDDDISDGDSFLNYVKRLDEKYGPVENYSLRALIGAIIHYESLWHSIILNKENRKSIDFKSLKQQLEIRLEQLYDKLDRKEEEYLRK